jgi:APA family basic amino acid/polyamine antiporter
MVTTTSLVVGGVIGSGIFFGPQTVAALQPYGLTILLVWLIAGLISLLGALSISELGAMLPSSGGFYVYLREAYGPLPAFLTGWATLLVSDGLAAIAVVFGTLLHFLAPSPLGPAGYAVLLVAFLTIVNIRGLRFGAVVQNASTALKLAALGAVIVAGLLAGSRAQGLAPLLPPAGAELGLFAAFGVALVPALFAYDGWYYVARVAEEVKDPSRTLPRSVILGTVLVMAVYLAMNFVYANVLGPQGLADIGTGSAVGGQASPAVAVAGLLLGPAAVVLIALAVVVSTFGASNTSVLTAPRIFYGMARDGLFFRACARVHPRWGTPWVAIALHGAVTMVLAATGTFLQLILLSTFTTFVFSGLAVGAVLKLRRDRPDLPRPYLTPGYPWVPLAVLALTVLFLASTIAAQPLFLGAFVVALAAGVPLFLWLRSGQPRRALREVRIADR